MKTYLKENWGFLLYMSAGCIAVKDGEWFGLIAWFLFGLAVVMYRIVKAVTGEL